MKRQPVVKDISWIQRNPRAFIGIFVTTTFLFYMHGPLYDLFMTKPDPAIYEEMKNHRSKLFPRD